MLGDSPGFNWSTEMMRTLFLLMALLSSTVAPANDMAPVEVPHISDLRDEAHQARRETLPILLMFSAEHCGFCRTVKEEFLQPMLISGLYEDKVIIRRLELDSFETLRDFDGSEIDPDALSERYGIHVTPTLVLLDHQGNDLGGRLVGISTPDFYGGYLDAAIDSALKRVQSRAEMGF